MKGRSFRFEGGLPIPLLVGLALAIPLLFLFLTSLLLAGAVVAGVAGLVYLLAPKSLSRSVPRPRDEGEIELDSRDFRRIATRPEDEETPR